MDRDGALHGIPICMLAAGSEPGVRQYLGDRKSFRGVHLKNVGHQISRLCARRKFSMARIIDAPHAPSESHSGSSYTPFMTFSLMTPSSSSSKGSVPVRSVYSMTPRDQTSTSAAG